MMGLKSSRELVFKEIEYIMGKSDKCSLIIL